MHTSTLLKTANRLLIKKANDLLKAHGIMHAYTYFLMELYQQDGLTQSEIHKRIGIEQPTAVRTLDRMERDGFITREPSLIDRRAIHIMLTKKALKYQKIILDCAEKLNDAALRGFSNADQKLLNQLTNRLIDNLK